ncbi:MAG: hypothetical protein U0793_15475 [Gemmataceae bacterium]
MSMVCPQCKQVFEQRLSCPACGVRLQFQVSSYTPSAPAAAADEDNWQKTPWGRMVIGLLLAQGLAYSIQQMISAGFMASGEHGPVWSTLWGIVLLHAVQGMTLIIGGAICGAGQRRGTLYGSLIGLINGIIFLFLQRQTGDVFTEAAIIGQPILHLAFGALGGLLGTLIWRPTPVFTPPPEAASTSNRPKISLPASFRLFDGPVHLTRVLFGIAIVVGGVMWSNVILEFALNASQGALALRSHLQAQLVSWEISGLAILFGSGLAGACTFNGFKQGLCVGLGAALSYAAMQLGNPTTVLEKTLLMMLAILVLSLAGGWFGGQLLPPLSPSRPKNRILTG